MPGRSRWPPVTASGAHGRAGKVADLHGVHPPEAAAIISHELAQGGGWLTPLRVTELLRCYGLPLIDTHVVPGADEAVATAQTLGRPVALKASAKGLDSQERRRRRHARPRARRRGP